MNMYIRDREIGRLPLELQENVHKIPYIIVHNED